jgi:alkylhydroperoxidase family enzyme
MKKEIALQPRIAPLEPPFTPEAADELARWQPGDFAPIALFRTLVRHLPLAHAMYPLGHYFLGPSSSLKVRDRDDAQLAASVAQDCDAQCWTDAERLLIRMVDELHDSGRLTDDLWTSMAARWSPEQLLELIVLAGWYHTISFVANGAQVPLEQWGKRFPSRKYAGSQSTPTARQR